MEEEEEVLSEKSREDRGTGLYGGKRQRTRAPGEMGASPGKS
jgi:hypothetical protein